MTSLFDHGSSSRLCRQVRTSGLRFAIRCIALQLFAWPNQTYAGEPCVDYADFLLELGGVATGSSGQFAVGGDFAYLAAGGSGVVVIDVSNSSSPQIVRTVPIPSGSVEVSGTRLYASHQTSIHVLDLTDPSDPVFLETVPIPGTIWDMVVDGNLLYVGATNGFYIVDPEASTPILGTQITAAAHLDVTFPYAYLSDMWTSRLVVVDVSQPSAPAVVGSMSYFPYSIADLASTGSSLCVLGQNSMRVVDVSNPASPTFLGAVSIPGSITRSIAMSGSLAYIGAGAAGLQVVDVSDPLQPRRLNEISPMVNIHVRFVTVFGEVAYYTDVSDDYNELSAGFRIADVSNPSSPVLASLDTPGFATAIAIDGTTAYVADGSSGVQIIDVTDSESPLIRGGLDTPGLAKGISLDGDYAYIADYEAGLQIVDISNPAAPVLAGSADTPGLAFDVEVRNGFAYVADGGMQVIDVTDPTSPELLTGVAVPGGQAIDVTLSGNYAYLACRSGGVQVASLANPASPVLVGSALIGDVHEIIVQGQFAYVACGSSGFRMLSVTNPASPVLISTLATSSPVTGLAVTPDGSVAYLELQGEGIRIVDLVISNPPVTIGQSFEVSEPSGLALAGNRLFVTSASGLASGLTILPGQCTTTTAVTEGPARRRAGLRVWPNPVVASTTLQFEIVNADEVRLDIIDVAGRRVRTLIQGMVETGPRIVHWDGRDFSGRRAARGMYFARLRTQSGISTTRVTLLELH